MKLGRLPRKYDPRVPHLSALLAGRRGALAPPPPSCDYTKALPDSLGMMGNDRLGDCTCAAIYHALQVWTANASPPIDTQPDSSVLSLYEAACGYNPNDPKTDAGGVEQDVLTYAMLAGLPVNEGSGRHRISAFIELDPSNFADVKLALFTAGLVYLGFNVPSYIMDGPRQVWDVQPGDADIEGGHAVIAAGYDADGLNIISWGSKSYRMTWAFWAKYVDEAYMIADADWITSSGKSPAGLSLLDLETQMQALRSAGLSDSAGRVVAVPFAPTGLQQPVPHDPQLVKARTDLLAAEQRATDAENRAKRAEGLAAEHQAAATEHRARAQELGKHVEGLQQTIGEVTAERDQLQEQLAAATVADAEKPA